MLLFFSLEWPLAVWGHELFYVHQIGIMIARIVSPMLIAISHPAGFIVAGLPRPVRTRMLKPALLAPPARKAWRFINTPVFVLGCYVGSLYFWEIPNVQASALANPITGISMHVSLLTAGLLSAAQARGAGPDRRLRQSRLSRRTRRGAARRGAARRGWTRHRDDVVHRCMAQARPDEGMSERTIEMERRRQ